MANYYQRRKCSQNVYFLEKSRERGSEPVLKEILGDNTRRWSPSRAVTLADDKNTTSMTTLRIPASTGYDWRRDNSESSVENSPRELRVMQRATLRQTILDEVKSNTFTPDDFKPSSPKPTSPKLANSKPTSPKGTHQPTPKAKAPTPNTTLTTLTPLQEQNRKLRQLLNQCSSQNRLIKAQNQRLQRQQKELEQQVRQRNHRLDEVEREKWLANHRLVELQRQNAALQERFKNSVDPNDFEMLRRKVEMLEQLQQEMERAMWEEGAQWDRDRNMIQQQTNILKKG